MTSKGYSLRSYRSLEDQDLKSFRVVIRETDLLIRVDAESYREGLAAQVEKVVFQGRLQLEDYIQRDPTFRTTLKPYLVPAGAPVIVRRLVQAANPAHVGPMAAVAGVFAELAGSFLKGHCQEVIVENGGDIYLLSTIPRRVAVLAGDSPFSRRIALEVPSRLTPCGICTSSRSVGPSLSLGKADAAVILAENAPLADAVATATANHVQNKEDVHKAVDFAAAISGVLGILIVKDDVLAVWGQAKLLTLADPTGR